MRPSVLLLATLLATPALLGLAPLAGADESDPCVSDPFSPGCDDDGDGLSNGGDWCPAEAGPAPHGCPDWDGDGDKAVGFGGQDCDDHDPLRHGGAYDRPNNGIDEDCDGQDAVAYADLLIESVTFLPVHGNGNVHVHVTVHNAGMADAGTYMQTGTADGSACISPQERPPLAAGETATYFACEFHPVDSSVAVEIGLDTYDWVAESDEANNFGQRTWVPTPSDAPDLVAESAESVVVGASYAVRITYRNGGPVAASAFLVYAYDAGGSLCGWREIPSLGAGGVDTVDLCSFSTSPAQVRIVVDEFDNVVEYDESNNEIFHMGPADVDHDGVSDDIDNCVAFANADQADMDGDGTGDVCDDDLDGDGTSNGSDTHPQDPSLWSDWDGDGWNESANNGGGPLDNCVGYHNPGQADLDGDGYGDPCDDDADGDGATVDNSCVPSSPTSRAVLMRGASYGTGDRVIYSSNPCDPKTHTYFWYPPATACEPCEQTFYLFDQDHSNNVGSLRLHDGETGAVVGIVPSDGSTVAISLYGSHYYRWEGVVLDGAHRYVDAGYQFLGDYTDCDDLNAARYVGATEVAGNGIDEDCDGVDASAAPVTDADADGYAAIEHGGADCNDNDSSIFPGAYDAPGNGVDEDCDGVDAPAGPVTDADNDGYDAIEHGGTDCNDNDPHVHPGTEEIMGNDVDENCDGYVAPSPPVLPRALFVTAADPAIDPRGPLFGEAGLSVAYSATIPADLSAYVVVVLENYDAFSSGTTSQLQAYVADGGSVLLAGATPYFLCGSTYHIGCLGWFGSDAQYWNAGNAATVVAAGPFGTSMTTGTVLVSSTANTYSQATIFGVDATLARVVATWQTMYSGRTGTPAFAVEADPVGGRVVWTSHFAMFPGSTPANPDLLVAELTWLAAGAGAPPADSDGDGILDAQDACVETPGVAPSGCPTSITGGISGLDGWDGPLALFAARVLDGDASFVGARWSRIDAWYATDVLPAGLYIVGMGPDPNGNGQPDDGLRPFAFAAVEGCSILDLSEGELILADFTLADTFAWSGCPFYPGADEDSDGVLDDVVDNCVGTTNPDQADADQDGVGDACGPLGPVPVFTGMLSATAGAQTESILLGVREGATDGFDAGVDAVQPPAPPTATWVRPVFSYPGNPENARELRASFYAPAHELSWPLVVQARGPVDASGVMGPVTVQLSWDIQEFQVPGYLVQLVDGANVVDMGAMDGHEILVPGREAAGRSGFATYAVEIRIVPDVVDLSFAIEDILVEGYEGTGEIVEGHPLTFHVTLRNLGYRDVDGGALLFEVDGLTQTFTFGHVAAGGSTLVEMPLGPVHARGAFIATFTATSSPDERPETLGDNQVALPFFVKDYEVTTSGIHAYRFAPGESKTFDVVVTNVGNVADALLLDAEGLHSGWTATFSADYLALGAGESATVQVTLESPHDGTGPGMEYGFVVSIVAASENDGAERDAGATIEGFQLPGVERTFAAGWHMFSLPLATASMDAATLLPGIDVVYRWTGTGYEAVETLVVGEGYWVYVPEETTLRFVGDTLYEVEHHDLGVGWRMIGGNSFRAEIERTSADNEGSLESIVYTWTAAGYFAQDARDGPLYADATHAYWVFVSSGFVDLRIRTQL